MKPSSVGTDNEGGFLTQLKSSSVESVSGGATTELTEELIG